MKLQINNPHKHTISSYDVRNKTFLTQFLRNLCSHIEEEPRPLPVRDGGGVGAGWKLCQRLSPPVYTLG